MMQQQKDCQVTQVVPCTHGAEVGQEILGRIPGHPKSEPARLQKGHKGHRSCRESRRAAEDIDQKSQQEGPKHGEHPVGIDREIKQQSHADEWRTIPHDVYVIHQEHLQNQKLLQKLKHQLFRKPLLNKHQQFLKHQQILTRI